MKVLRHDVPLGDKIIVKYDTDTKTSNVLFDSHRNKYEWGFSTKYNYEIHKQSILIALDDSVYVAFYLKRPMLTSTFIEYE